MIYMGTVENDPNGESNFRLLAVLIVSWIIGSILGLESYLDDGNTIGLVVGALFLGMAILSIGQELWKRAS